MAYDSTAFIDANASPVQTAVSTEDRFRRSERLVVVFGAAAMGALAGVAAAFTMGRVGMWPLAIGAPLYLFTLYLTMANFRDAAERRAFGCATLAGLVAATLIAWPVVAFSYASSSAFFWAAPAAVIGGLFLSASCWGGASTSVYRLSCQSMFVMGAVSFLGATTLLA